MFWGLIIEPNKRYTQTVEKSFHVSMACLDRSSADDGDVQVVVCYDGCSFLACTLNKGTVSQTPLDLYFEEGSKISFMSNGQGQVHLTGYVLPEDDLDPDECEEDDDDEEEEEEEEVPQLVRTKRKAAAKENNKAKRLKIAQKEEESSDDGDNLVDPTLAFSDDENSDDDDVDSEDAEEDDEDEDVEDEEEEEEEESSDEKQVEVPVKQQKKAKQKEKQQQQQQNKKVEKQKLVNGKDAKQESEQKQQKQKKKNKGEQNQQQPQQKQNNEQNVQKKRIVEGGVQIEDIKVGDGPLAKPGKFVSVHYVGRLKNGKKFDSTTQGDGFKFRLGKGEVIKGWDIGIAGLKVGGKRRITIPPAMAYGARGSPPTIPSNSTLIFEVELKNVH